MTYRTVGAALAVLGALPVAASAASIRVEGAARTQIPETSLTVQPGTFIAGDDFDNDTIQVTTDSATAQLTLAAFWFARPISFSLFNFGSGPSSFITQIGADRMPASGSPSWRLKVNRKITEAGADDIKLGPTDVVLWSYGTSFTEPELDLTVSKRSLRSGTQLIATVRKYDNNGVASPARGAVVRFRGKTLIANVNGRVALNTRAPGAHIVSAKLVGAVRSPERLVCIGARVAPACSAVTFPAPNMTTEGPHLLTGLVSSPAGVRRVDVTVAQRDGSSCRFLRPNGTLTGLRSCGQPVIIGVGARSGRWVLPVTGPDNQAGLLPTGRYRLTSRAVTATGRERSVTPRNTVNFTVVDDGIYVP